MEQPEHSVSLSAQVVLPAGDLDESIRFFRDELGFRLERIFPADAPRVAIMSGHGLALRLDTESGNGPSQLRIETADPSWPASGRERLVAPGGTAIEVVRITDAVVVPPLAGEFLVTRPQDAAAWSTGRAGMQYRDLIPGRLGGAVIASHIRIPDGGPVPDYVHHHHVRFQIIFCLRGWTRLVYEDQGPDFIMHAGDCVLQPPHIRHRVLECSDGFEVVEIGAPAEHETLVDHELPLPNDRVDRQREFGGQRFVLSQAGDAAWSASADTGLDTRDTGIERATDGLVTALLRRPAAGIDRLAFRQDEPLWFGYLTSGGMTVSMDERAPVALGPDCALVVPAGSSAVFSDLSDDLEWLEVVASP